MDGRAWQPTPVFLSGKFQGQGNLVSYSPWDHKESDTHTPLESTKVKVKSLSRVRLLATPWTAAYQAPPSMGFSRQEYWSGVFNFCSDNMY